MSAYRERTRFCRWAALVNMEPQENVMKTIKTIQEAQELSGKDAAKLIIQESCFGNRPLDKMEKIIGNRFLHICECCGKTESLTAEEAFDAGWDYPPTIGFFGIVSTRTCGNCSITDTAWWKLTCEHIPFGDLDERYKETIMWILQEPEILMLEGCETLEETTLSGYHEQNRTV